MSTSVVCAGVSYRLSDQLSSMYIWR